MKKVIAFILALATALSLCACGSSGSSAGGKTSAGSKNAPEPIIVNLSDYYSVPASVTNPDFIYFNGEAFKSVLRPYLKNPDLYNQLSSYIYDFSAYTTNQYITPDSVTIFPKVSKHLLEAIREMVTVEIVYADSVTIPLTGNAKVPETNRKIDWKNYFTVETYGRNTGARAEIRPNYAKILKDFADLGPVLMFHNHRDERYPSPEAALIQVFYTMNGILEINKRGEITNGDTLEVRLSEYYLDNFTDCCLETEAGTMTHSVKGLPEFVPVDPFANATVYVEGIHDTLLYNTETIFFDKDNSYGRYRIACETERKTPIHEGDTVKVSLGDSTIESHGADYFTRTEAELTVSLPQLPNSENARLFLDNMANDDLSIPERFVCTQATFHTRAEVCGRLFYYNDNGRLEADPENVTVKEWNNNRLVCIIKANSPEYPGEWYTYLILRDALKLYQLTDLNTGEMKPVPLTQDAGKDMLGAAYYLRPVDFASGIPILFSVDGHDYRGYKTLEETLAAINSVANRGLNYDHLIVSSELQGIVTEH